MNIPEFFPGQSAGQAHLALKKSVEILDRAQHCAVLWFAEILKRRLFKELGYSSIYQYAAEELGFSPTRTGDFKRLAEKLDKLPAVAAKVRTGELGYTKAREIVKVADPATEEDWLEVAEGQSRRELEATVRQARKRVALERNSKPGQGELVPREMPSSPPAATPVRVSFDLTPLQHARYAALLARIGHQGDRADLLLDMMETFLGADESAPRGASESRYQIHVHQCPTCSKTSVPTPQGERELDDAEAEAVKCDAMIHQSGRRSSRTIPPRIRREVLARDRHRCQRKGCGHNRFLEIHHLVPRSAGGTNDPANLVTLCSSCHRLWHQMGGDLRSLLSARMEPGRTLISRTRQDLECSKPPAST
jgi:5-methylcytosine-specific restriction endonuclease McrA